MYYHHYYPYFYHHYPYYWNNYSVYDSQIANNHQYMYNAGYQDAVNQISYINQVSDRRWY